MAAYNTVGANKAAGMKHPPRRSCRPRTFASCSVRRVDDKIGGLDVSVDDVLLVQLLYGAQRAQPHCLHSGQVQPAVPRLARIVQRLASKLTQQQGVAVAAQCSSHGSARCKAQ